jgi:anthranilate phosphoribosyltransferase
LTNPASANSQLLGVYDPKMVTPLANALNKLGCEEAMVVHGLDGLDEISTLGKSSIAWLKGSQVTHLETNPKYFGVKKAKPEELRVSTPEESAKIIFKILNGKNLADAKAEMVLVNSAAGIIVGGKAEDFIEGMQIAKESIASGKAYAKLKALISTSGGNLQKLEELEAKYE